MVLGGVISAVGSLVSGSLGAGFGLGLGTIAGLSVGPYVFERMHVPKQYSKVLSEEADKDRSIDAPEPGTIVPPEMRALLEYCEPWALQPYYERVSMINRLLAVMWPSITAAVMTEVVKQVRPQLKAQVFDKFPFIEDIVLGTMSMKEGVAWDTWIKDKPFTIGSVPPRVGGINCCNTSDDEVILDVPLVWGSNCKLNVGVFLKAGPVRLYVPVEVANLQFKVDTRITVKPLVEEIPCVGGVTITLLKAPHLDLQLSLVKGVDLMALPIIKDGLRFGIQYMLNGLVIHPNNMSFPIMKKFGVPDPAKGALCVKVLRAEGLRGDETYVRLELRKGRPVYSRSVKGTKNPEYNQEFNLIVDDFLLQQLDITIYDDDLGWNDTPIAAGQIRFAEIIGSTMNEATGRYDDEVEYRDFIQAPMREVMLELPLIKPFVDEMGEFRSAKSVAHVGMKTGGSFFKKVTRGGSMEAAVVVPATESRGKLYLKVMFMPFLQPQYDDEEEEAEAAARKAVPKRITPLVPSNRAVRGSVSDQVKGVLTVHLIRCINLKGDDPTTYVRFIVSDDESEQDQEMKSTTILAENSPRWGTKFDFVMVRAASHLYVTVFRKASLAANVVSKINVFKQKNVDSDKPIGKLALPVKDAARNGFIKDIWTLEDVEHGQIELALSWQTCEVPDT